MGLVGTILAPKHKQAQMNVAPGPANAAAMGVAMQMQAPNRAYTVKPAAQEDTEPKAITSEQIQAMLDENSNLIVEIITLNNQIKQAKGTGQQGDVMEKLDKKRKKLNKNLMTLAKWADESSDQPPRPPPTAYYNAPAQAQYAPRGMAMNTMGMASQMAHPQMQMAPRYNQAQMQAMAQAQAQYRAHMSTMGSHAGYGNMPAAQPRYHDPTMAAYGGMAPVMRPMPMSMPAGYGGGAPMGYAMAPPHGYGMVTPQQVMPRMGGAPDGNAAGAGGVANPDGAGN